MIALKKFSILLWLGMVYLTMSVTAKVMPIFYPNSKLTILTLHFCDL